MRTWKLAMPALCAATLILAAGALAQESKDEPLTDEVFVKKAASGGLYEVQSSQIAQRRATDEDAKAFAQKMITDHTKANNELMRAASAAGFQVSRTLMPKHQMMIDKLSGLQEQEFDREYWTQQNQAHIETVKLFEQASKGLRDAELKSFASRTLPVLREHLAMTKEHVEASK